MYGGRPEPMLIAERDMPGRAICEPGPAPDKALWNGELGKAISSYLMEGYWRLRGLYNRSFAVLAMKAIVDGRARCLKRLGKEESSDEVCITGFESANISTAEKTRSMRVTGVEPEV